MAENFFCDEEGCGLPAHVFGFVDGVKRKACEKHVLTLTLKQVTVYGIAAISFMQSSKDILLYEEKRERMQRGLGAVASLETACEQDWVEWQRHLQENCVTAHEVVNQCFYEVRLRGQECYEEMRRDLKELRTRLEQLTRSKEFELTIQDSTVCDSAPSGPLFCVMVDDIRCPVAELLMTHVHILTRDMREESQKDWADNLQAYGQDQANKGATKVAAQAAVYAKQLGVSGPNFQEEALQASEDYSEKLRCLLYVTTRQEAEKCLEAGKSASLTGDFERALTELQRGRDLLSDSDDWELYLQLDCNMAEIYFQTDRYEDTVEVCELIMSTWNPKAHILQYFRSIYYLFGAYIGLKQIHQMLAIMNQLGKGSWIPHCSDCQCVLLCIDVVLFMGEKGYEEAEQCLKKALQLEVRPSLITLHCRNLLGAIYKSIFKI